MKQCTKCKEFKPIDQFPSKSWINSDGSVTKTKRSHCRPCTNKSNIDRYHNNSSTKKSHKTASYKHRIKRYGMTVEQYEIMLEQQDDKCYVCGDKSDKKLCIDHDHKTGKVRKLICNNCNTALGHAKDDVTRLEKLIDYLKEHNE